MSSKHEFAFYCALPNKLNPGDIVTVNDAALVNRLTHIVRLKSGEQCILFDQKKHANGIFRQANKNSAQIEVVAVEPHMPHKPCIEVLLPLLKREDFELALYGMVELGATKIQLVETQKAQRSWSGAKDADRATRIMVAACEQSKNYSLPILSAPTSLQTAVDLVNKQGIAKIFFDPSGDSILDTLQAVKAQNAQTIVLMVGPEGDLTEQEKLMLKEHGFIFCALTPTVLRSVQAVQLGLGIFRSVFRG